MKFRMTLKARRAAGGISCENYPIWHLGRNTTPWNLEKGPKLSEHCSGVLKLFVLGSGPCGPGRADPFREL